MSHNSVITLEYYRVVNLTKFALFIMADVDEDVIPRGPGHEEDIDLSDETQDFRFLLAFSYVQPIRQYPAIY